MLLYCKYCQLAVFNFYLTKRATVNASPLVDEYQFYPWCVVFLLLKKSEFSFGFLNSSTFLSLKTGKAFLKFIYNMHIFFSKIIMIFLLILCCSQSKMSTPLHKVKQNLGMEGRT